MTRTLLLYVREANGGLLSGLLDGLDLDEPYLLDTNNWVSHAFLQILYRRMIEILADPNAVYNMTLSAKRTQPLGLLDRIARLVGNPRLLYTQAPKYNRMLKLNGEVIIREVGDSWIILEDQYRDNRQKTKFDCDYTRGMLAGLPTIFDMPLARVTELTCQVDPDAYGSRSWSDRPSYDRRGCLYKVEWEQDKLPPFWKRIFARKDVYKQAIDDLYNANQEIQKKYEVVKKLYGELEEVNQSLKESQEKLEKSTADLQASEAKYRLLAESVTDIIWSMDLREFRLTYVSPSVEGMMGFTADEVMGRTLKQILSPRSFESASHALRDELTWNYQSHTDPNRVRTIEIELLHADGSYRWAEATVAFIRDENNRPANMLGVTRDITERKKVESERARLEEDLRQAQKLQALGTLAGGIAHDFNNIIGAIMGFAELAQIASRSGQTNDVALEGIVKSADRARDLVRQILTFGRKAEADRRPLNLNDTVREALKMLEPALPKMIRIDSDLAPDLALTFADSSQVQQVILNLATNSVDALPEGGVIRLETGNYTHDPGREGQNPEVPPGAYVMLKFSDNGKGMDSAIRENVFDPFFTTKSVGKGTGLGLSTVFGIVKAHEGHIYCDSVVGEGTTFRIYFPATQDAEYFTAAPQSISEDLVKGSETILLVDDEEALRDLASEHLTLSGYKVIKAASGEEALAIYDQNSTGIDAVVLDLNMPGIGGHKCLQRLLEMNPRVKVIIASGYSADGQQQVSLASGAKSFLPKPYKRLELLATVKEVVLGR